MTTFAHRGIIYGVRIRGWQVDYRPDGWLPLGIRTGRNGSWGTVLPLGRLGCVVVGKSVWP